MGDPLSFFFTTSRPGVGEGGLRVKGQHQIRKMEFTQVWKAKIKGCDTVLKNKESIKCKPSKNTKRKMMPNIWLSALKNSECEYY